MNLMNKYQIQTKVGFVLGCIDAASPNDAVNKLAIQKGYESFPKWCEIIGLKADYEVNDFRIILSNEGGETK